MAHQIERNKETGKHEFAYTGQKAWHSLGQELDKNASIETWIKEAQMDWEVHGAPVEYVVEDELYVMEGKQILHRSDDKSPLGIVSDRFKIVQPKEVLEFFRDLVEIYDMQLSAAGCLFGGKRFFATAETGNASSVLKGDEIKGYLVLMTGVDGTLSTIGKFAATRVVCNNTLTLALSENSKQVRATHSQDFDPKAFKIELGLLNESWNNYINDMTKLTEVKMDDNFARKFFIDLVKKQDETYNDYSRTTEKTVTELMYRLQHGLGAEMGRGTAWNVLNAVTEKYTHGTGRKSADYQFVNSLYGSDEKIKQEATNKLLELV